MLSSCKSSETNYFWFQSVAFLKKTHIFIFFFLKGRCYFLFRFRIGWKHFSKCCNCRKAEGYYCCSRRIKGIKTNRCCSGDCCTGWRAAQLFERIESIEEEMNWLNKLKRKISFPFKIFWSITRTFFKSVTINWLIYSLQ